MHTHLHTNRSMVLELSFGNERKIIVTDLSVQQSVSVCKAYRSYCVALHHCRHRRCHNICYCCCCSLFFFYHFSVIDELADLFSFVCFFFSFCCPILDENVFCFLGAFVAILVVVIIIVVNFFFLIFTVLVVVFQFRM